MSCLCASKWKRRPEWQAHAKWDYIAEPANTLSNAGFLLASVGCMCMYMVRIIQHLDHSETTYKTLNGPLDVDTIGNLILLLFLAGVCSGIHHALCDRFRYTIVLDWIPIAWSLYIVFVDNFDRLSQIWAALSMYSIFWLALALLVLIEDHVFQNVRVPWGHVAWHLLAAIAIANCYVDLILGLGANTLGLTPQTPDGPNGPSF